MHNRVCKSSQYSLVFKSASVVYEVANYFLLKWKIAVVYYYYWDKDLIGFLSKLRIKRELLLTLTESMQLHNCAKAALKIKGDYAEVGVYKGGSAKVIAQVKGNNKKLHLFDTFAGLPSISRQDKYFGKGEYMAPLHYAQRLLQGYSKIYFYPGFFPKTTIGLKTLKFAFVHLDVDLYESTKDALEYFYPRMSVGGMILSHDYPSSVGVRKAFDEFFKDKIETVLKLSGNQGLVVKRGSDFNSSSKLE